MNKTVIFAIENGDVNDYNILKPEILGIKFRKNRRSEGFAQKRIVTKFTAFPVFYEFVFHAYLVTVQVDNAVVTVGTINFNIVSEKLESHVFSSIHSDAGFADYVSAVTVCNFRRIIFIILRPLMLELYYKRFY